MRINLYEPEGSINNFFYFVMDNLVNPHHLKYPYLILQDNTT